MLLRDFVSRYRVLLSLLFSFPVILIYFAILAYICRRDSDSAAPTTVQPHVRPANNTYDDHKLLVKAILFSFNVLCQGLVPDIPAT
jgi:hypothetical protein